MLRFADADIGTWCGQDALRAGHVYFGQGRVIECARDGDRIRSRVQGTERKPYGQDIEVRGTGGRAASVTGACTCHVGP